MPWCDTCAKFWSPASVPADGRCPTCGASLDAPGAPAGREATDVGAAAPVRARDVDVKELAGDDARAPWHFKLLVGAIVVYLGWRVVQLAVWFVAKM